jgi:hypothetical protein
MKKRPQFVAVLMILLLVSCRAPPAVPTATPTPASSLDSDDYQLILDAAWQTVNDKYFDPTFGGSATSIAKCSPPFRTTKPSCFKC